MSVFTGGELLLQGRQVLLAQRLLRAGARATFRGDGIPESSEVRALLTEADAASERLRNMQATSEYRELPAVATSSVEDLIDLIEAAKLMGVSERNVRALCQRQTLVSGRKHAGRWLVDRAEVLGRIERKAS